MKGSLITKAHFFNHDIQVHSHVLASKRVILCPYTMIKTSEVKSYANEIITRTFLSILRPTPSYFLDEEGDKN